MTRPCKICDGETEHQSDCPAAYPFVWRVTSHGDGTVVVEVTDAVQMHHVVAAMALVATALRQGGHSFDVRHLN